MSEFLRSWLVVVVFGGLAVLLVSADLEELIGLADRLMVMLRGRVVAELDPATTTPRVLGGHMTGADDQSATRP